MSNKPGRNDPCPCNSGKKYKKCHGSPEFLERQRAEYLSRLQLQHSITRARHEAREYQRKEQQGLGRPIVSSELREHRIVAVGGKLLWSKAWKTFHDFLRDYPRIALGDDWWLEETRKGPSERHLIVSWLVRGSEFASAFVRENGSTTGIQLTGALSAYMRFAYDLYGLHHATEVQQLLMNRIKHPESFPGALYEIHVAAALLRAGFALQVEDETDRRSTHVEFVATHLATNTKYSVEAKRREGAKLRINRQMHRALNKAAEHPRIVFIDTNDSRLESARNERIPLPILETRELLKRYERDPVGKTLPPAYVIATHAPDEHHLDAPGLPYGILLWGFHIEDMRPGLKSLTEQVETRRRHAPIFALIDSMRRHRAIPATFDGEADAFALEHRSDRLRVGDRYVVPGPSASDIEATFESGVVMPEQKVAWCVFCSDEGERFFVQSPLSEAELRAYHQHPATFFGEVDGNAGRKPVKTSLDWFDFLWESYQHTPREKLLEFLRNAPDTDKLRQLDQKALATEYCARMASSIGRRMAQGDEKP